MSLSKYQGLEHLAISSASEYVLHIEMDRPAKRNALNDVIFESILKAFNIASTDEEVRVIIFSGRGKMFTAGLDLSGNGLENAPDIDPARKAFWQKRFIENWQDSVSSLERCQKPVIVALHGGAIGGAIDYATSGDIRICSKECIFSVREAAIGLAADIGTLQRIGKVVGNHSLIRDWAYTARDFGANEAYEAGLVSKVYDTPEELFKAAKALAADIATKSPVAVQGTKHILNYSRDHTVDDGLKYVATWNSVMLQTEDLPVAMMSAMSKSKPKFSKL